MTGRGRGEGVGRVGIVSYCDHLRTYAHVNHQYYAERHGYTYIYDIAPTHHTPYKNKAEKLLKFLDLFDWVFWIDDDAFFLQYDVPLEPFIEDKPGYDLIYCESPVNTVTKEDGERWTYLSSGNFFMKNTPKVREFLQAVIDGSRDVAKENWDEETMGFYGHGEQEIMVYLLTKDERFNGPQFHTRYTYEAFNTRPFHFKKTPDEHFLVHFTNHDKHQQALEFAARFSLSPALIPQADFDTFQGVGVLDYNEEIHKLKDEVSHQEEKFNSVRRRYVAQQQKITDIFRRPFHFLLRRWYHAYIKKDQIV